MVVAEDSSPISRKAWFFPLRTSTLVTLPKGMPRWTISASETSFGMLRMWMTRDGLPTFCWSSFTFLAFSWLLLSAWGADGAITDTFDWDNSSSLPLLIPM
jgi:hypothetical protein